MGHNMKAIIHPNLEGGICVIYPTGDVPIEDVCEKDVPNGVPYRVIDVSDIPEDRTFRAAWEADFTEPDGKGSSTKAYHERKAREREETERARIEAEAAHDNN